MASPAAAHSPQYNLMDAAARKLAVTFRRNFADMERAQVKPAGDAALVAKTKAEIMAVLQEELGKSGAPLLPPETSADKIPTKGPCWLVNPLVGGDNFAHGREPTGVRMVHAIDAMPVAAMTYFPLSDTSISAERGKGAVGWGRRLRVSGRKALEGSMLQAFIGPKGAPKGTMTALAKLCDDNGITLRVSGCLAHDLGEAGGGKVDAVLGVGLIPGELAFADLVLRESGGFIKDLHGRPATLASGALVAGSTDYLEPLLKAVAEASLIK